jgi:hypothetical protein
MVQTTVQPTASSTRQSISVRPRVLRVGVINYFEGANSRKTASSQSKRFVVGKLREMKAACKRNDVRLVVTNLGGHSAPENLTRLHELGGELKAAFSSKKLDLLFVLGEGHYHAFPMYFLPGDVARYDFHFDAEPHWAPGGSGTYMADVKTLPRVGRIYDYGSKGVDEQRYRQSPRAGSDFSRRHEIIDLDLDAFLDRYRLRPFYRCGTGNISLDRFGRQIVHSAPSVVGVFEFPGVVGKKALFACARDHLKQTAKNGGERDEAVARALKRGDLERLALLYASFDSSVRIERRHVGTKTWGSRAKDFFSDLAATAVSAKLKSKFGIEPV